VSFILANAWQAALVGAVALLAELLRARPGLRHAIWLAFAARLVLPPSLESPVGLTPAAAAPGGAWMAPLWIAGVVTGALLAWLGAGRARAALLRGAVPLEGDAVRRAAARLGMRRAPRVLVGETGPAAFGILRPAVVVPRRLVGALDPTALEHVLLHELAHVRRKDLVWQAIFLALNVLYWFHPLAWVARRRAYAARELLCDAAVASALGSAAPYRRTLLRAALLSEPPGAGAAAFRGGAFLARVRALDREPRAARAWRRLAAAAAGILLVAAAAPPPFDEAGDLRARLAHALANPESHGCLETRHLFLRAVALELEKNP
jgi:beta-lactamase regulating signal transducer with metallopeptidase domain